MDAPLVLAVHKVATLAQAAPPQLPSRKVVSIAAWQEPAFVRHGDPDDEVALAAFDSW
jgi:hypothetical protein